MRGIRLLLISLLGLATSAIALADGDSTPARSGEAVFEANCANCHTGGIGGFFTKAPDIDDKEDWETSIPKGLDGLTATTIAGIGGMEPRGACIECTDEEIRAAVEHILKKLK